MNYKFIRSLLFCLEPERAHYITLSVLKHLPQMLFPKVHGKAIEVMGLTLSHQVGLAAGMDKNGEYLDALAKLGFSFIEIGTVTPRPQQGNPKPRLFRIPEKQAVINRMGFNNNGVDTLIKNVERARYQGVLGINIGKNFDTDLNKAADDYLYCMQKVYSYASYITVNLSSPNTPDLRKLQQKEYFSQLIQRLREEQLHLADKHKTYVPLLIKVSPDETNELLKTMASEMVATGIDGIIAVNTTTSREAVKTLPNSEQAGGLSGKPLATRAIECMQTIKSTVGDELTIIGVGGIDSPDSAKKMITAGASLLQVYTGLIYQGPWLIKKIVKLMDPDKQSV